MQVADALKFLNRHAVRDQLLVHGHDLGAGSSVKALDNPCQKPRDLVRSTGNRSLTFAALIGAGTVRERFLDSRSDSADRP
jgi:hypothetical protein